MKKDREREVRQVVDVLCRTMSGSQITSMEAISALIIAMTRVMINTHFSSDDAVPLAESVLTKFVDNVSDCVVILMDEMEEITKNIKNLRKTN